MAIDLLHFMVILGVWKVLGGVVIVVSWAFRPPERSLA
jgi:hypothetical protein